MQWHSAGVDPFPFGDDSWDGLVSRFFRFKPDYNGD